MDVHLPTRIHFQFLSDANLLPMRYVPIVSRTRLVPGTITPRLFATHEQSLLVHFAHSFLPSSFFILELLNIEYPVHVRCFSFIPDCLYERRRAVLCAMQTLVERERLEDSVRVKAAAFQHWVGG